MSKLLKNILIILIIFIILYIVSFHVFDVKTIIMQKIYPQAYKEYVYYYAEKYEMDPLLIFAIIKAESNFNPEAISKSDAIGLMQLMENTAVEVARKTERKEVTAEELYRPQTNIQIGTCYFANLVKQYHNVGIALAAYNAGMGRVNSWIEQGIIKEDGSDLENIPYQETNMYVRKILNDYQIYQELYEEE